MRSVLVTGAGTGIGRAVAQLFSRHGFHVWLAGRREQMLQETAQILAQPSAICVLDLSNPASIASAVKSMLASANPPSCLINNAGIIARKSCRDSDLKLWHETFTTNLYGPAELTRLLWDHLASNGGASIVNISSTLGLHPVSHTSVYSASKAAMVNWTKTLALEGAPVQIRANCVCPGVVATPIHAFHGKHDAESLKTQKDYAAIHPLGRMGRAEEVAHSVVHFCLPGSEWTTGSVMTVDGGISLI